MRKESLKRMPLYCKALEIEQIVERIVQLVPEDHEFSVSIAQNVYENALQLGPRISAAEGVDLYDMKMESAAIIRKCAREIHVGCQGFLMEGFEEVEYLDMLKEEIEEFRLLFVAWTKSFDQWNYQIDRWGMFNPPGVDYDQKDPDEDLPPDASFDDPEL